jgi:hypothetical protein
LVEKFRGVPLTERTLGRRTWKIHRRLLRLRADEAGARRIFYVRHGRSPILSYLVFNSEPLSRGAWLSSRSDRGNHIACI